MHVSLHKLIEQQLAPRECKQSRGTGSRLLALTQGVQEQFSISVLESQPQVVVVGGGGAGGQTVESLLLIHQ